MNLAKHDKDELLAMVYSFTARLYGQSRAKRKTMHIAAELHANGDEGVPDATG